MTTERQRWERMALQALAALVEDLASKGEYASAISHAQRYLAIDDLSEEIHRRLIELYALAGDRAAAARQYEHLVAVLERELGLDPLPETQALYRAVQAGRAPRRISPTPSPIKAHLLSPDVPLVGREDAWRALEEAYGRARSGRGQFVLISGEAGIGKSRLMQDFCDHLQRQCILLIGAGYPETQTSPYQPIVEALRSRLSMEPFSLAAYPSWLAEASRLLPELRALHPGLPEPPVSEPGWARARLFESSGDDPGRHGSRRAPGAAVPGRSALGRPRDPGLAGLHGPSPGDPAAPDPRRLSQRGGGNGSRAAQPAGAPGRPAGGPACRTWTSRPSTGFCAVSMRASAIAQPWLDACARPQGATRSSCWRPPGR